MSLGSPFFLGLLALAVPVVVFFLSRRKVKQVDVSSVQIYRVLLTNRPTRRSFAALRHLVALLLTLLALGLLVLALIDVRGSSDGPRDYVVVLDTSASMGTVEEGRSATRYQRALDELDAFIRDLNDEDRVALVTAGPVAAVGVGFTRNRETVLEAARSVVPAGRGTGDASALRIADGLCATSDHASVVLFSDGVHVSAPDLTCRPSFVHVGDTASNVGITALAVREADAFGLTEIFLAVDNAHPEAREVTVELSLDGAAKFFEVVTLDVDANGHTEKLLRLPLPAGEVLEARLADSDVYDGLAEDDVAYALASPGTRVRGLLVTDRPGGFLASALKLHPRLDLTIAAPNGTISSLPYDLVVLESDVATVPKAGRVITFGANLDTFGISTGGTVDRPQVIRWTFDDELFRWVDLQDLEISGSRLLNVPADGRSMLDASQGALAVDTLWQGRSVVAFGFPVTATDFPMRVGFLNFLANAVEWAAPAGVETSDLAIGTGERLANAAVGMRLQPVAGGDDLDATRPVTAPGAYLLLGAGGRRLGTVTASLLSADDSAIAPVDRLPLETEAGTPRIASLHALPWRWVVLAGLVVLGGEWMLPGVALAIGGLWNRLFGRRKPARRQRQRRASVAVDVARRKVR